MDSRRVSEIRRRALGGRVLDRPDAARRGAAQELKSMHARGFPAGCIINAEETLGGRRALMSQCMRSCFCCTAHLLCCPPGVTNITQRALASCPDSNPSCSSTKLQPELITATPLPVLCCSLQLSDSPRHRSSHLRIVPHHTLASVSTHVRDGEPNQSAFQSLLPLRHQDLLAQP